MSPDSPQNLNSKLKLLQKTPTGIEGLDEITNGGLPTGRPTLICGGTGLWKNIVFNGVSGGRRYAVWRTGCFHGF